MPTLIAVVDPESNTAVVTDKTTGRPIMMLPGVILEVMDTDGEHTGEPNNEHSDDNKVRFLLQPASAAGLFVRLAQYFEDIGLDVNPMELENFGVVNDYASAACQTLPGEDESSV